MSKQRDYSCRFLRKRLVREPVFSHGQPRRRGVYYRIRTHAGIRICTFTCHDPVIMGKINKALPLGTYPMVHANLLRRGDTDRRTGSASPDDLPDGLDHALGLSRSSFAILPPPQPPPSGFCSQFVRPRSRESGSALLSLLPRPDLSLAVGCLFLPTSTLFRNKRGNKGPLLSDNITKFWGDGTTKAGRGQQTNTYLVRVPTMYLRIRRDKKLVL
ncbi:uncharacterized protein F4812DRAFT_209592 [Daldinia caldariorum]|uniref:uncharacterized protein n=1 Tax=Daldinia caldariorum TaxID=326644 RepID=UPI002007C7CA|nr:uncharacterized protein F4812DRAFT_209592 [Daldinia caldariorum]KAI1464383.1 hypothetical protein F4812DRAFT_209592 [Daldinia caldariorum]